MCSIECFHMTSRRPCWCPKPVLWELNSFLMQTLSFVPINLHRCWPREWKHSIQQPILIPNFYFATKNFHYSHKKKSNPTGQPDFLDALFSDNSHSYILAFMFIIEACTLNISSQRSEKKGCLACSQKTKEDGSNTQNESCTAM